MSFFKQLFTKTPPQEWSVIEFEKETSVEELQRIFDVVCKRALELDAPVWGYRTANGPCLIGVLINDEQYNESIEGFSVRSDNVWSRVKRSGFNIQFEDSDFLDRIQAAHDSIGSETGSSFKYKLFENLEKVSFDFNVKIPDFYFH